MMSRRPDQQGLFSADTQYLDFLGPESFYGFLAQHGRELFADEDFAELYCPDNGRPSVAPSPLAIALLLQARALEKTDHFREQYRQRIVVEHRIARLVQLGVRKSRFFGPAKTRFQLLMAATVANLTLVAKATGSAGFLRLVLAPLAAFRSYWPELAHPRRTWPEGRLLVVV